MSESDSRSVFVLTEEPFHDNSSILGVFESRELAEAEANRLVRERLDISTELMIDVSQKLLNVYHPLDIDRLTFHRMPTSSLRTFTRALQANLTTLNSTDSLVVYPQ